MQNWEHAGHKVDEWVYVPIYYGIEAFFSFPVMASSATTANDTVEGELNELIKLFSQLYISSHFKERFNFFVVIAQVFSY